MSELCHCPHNFNKRSCLHKDFCATIARQKIIYQNQLEQLEQYREIGNRFCEQDGNWVMLHRGALEWAIEQFKNLKDRNEAYLKEEEIKK